jgi:4-diphosphocytidyl-2-C-methyl-D-erythritol kinase
MEQWHEAVPNVMESFVFRTWPEIGRVKERLLQAGAAYASMSGSGSSVYGLFRDRPLAMEWPAGYGSWTMLLNGAGR